MVGARNNQTASKITSGTQTWWNWLIDWVTDDQYQQMDNKEESSGKDCNTF